MSAPLTQDVVTARYDRIARFNDLFDKSTDLLGGRARRRRFLSRARGRTLEVGVGTGRNLAAYVAGVELTGIDVSEKMLNGARRRARTLSAEVVLELGDVQHLDFAERGRLLVEEAGGEGPDLHARLAGDVGVAQGRVVDQGVAHGALEVVAAAPAADVDGVVLRELERAEENYKRG